MCAKKSAKTWGRAKSSGGIAADTLLGRLKGTRDALAADAKLSLAAALKKNDLSSPLLLLSAQHLRVKRLVSWLRENLFLQNPDSFSYFFGNDLASGASVDNIRAALSSPSLFAPRQLIVIYEADKIKAPAQKALLETLSATTSSALLVLGAESVSTKSTLLTEVSTNGTLAELAELSGNALERWIDKEVQRSGGSSGIAADAKALLIQCYGGDISRLAPEIEKLALLTVPGTPISRGLVEAVSLKNPEVTSFELVKQLAAKNTALSVSLAQDLTAQGLHPLQISAFLSRALRTLIAQKSKDPGMQIHPELNNPWFTRQLGGALSSFSEKDLSRSIKVLTELDFKLKDSGLPPELTLTLAIQKLALRA